MAAKKQIGIFWGRDFLSVAETEGDHLTFAAAILRKPPASSSAIAESQDAFTPESIHLTASIQRLMRERKIIKPNVHIAIPASDIMLRSFTLPTMSAEELENAIAFEAPRHIPFKLNDMFYGYHAVPFSDKGIKKNRIFLLAIRKDTLNQYCKVIEEAQLDVQSAEPSLLALMRILSLKKLAKTNQVIAIVHIGDAQGSIMILDQQIPQMIRDFSLAAPSVESQIIDPKFIGSKILNEVRISLDFYTRQAKISNRENKVEHIYVFASHDIKETAIGIKADLGVETTFIDVNDVFPYGNQLHPNVAFAIGANLSGSTPMGVSFNLARARKIDISKSSQKGLGKGFGGSPNYKLTALIFTLCFLMVGGVFAKIYFSASPQQQKLLNLKTVNQKYQNMSAEMLGVSTKNIKEKIAAYKNIRFQSDITSCLENISLSLVDGVWLNDLKINFLNDAGKALANVNSLNTPGIKINLTGYSYNEQLNRQISLVEEFLKNLKENSFFKDRTKKIELRQVKKEEKQGFPVTLFQIDMEINETTK